MKFEGKITIRVFGEYSLENFDAVEASAQADLKEAPVDFISRFGSKAGFLLEIAPTNTFPLDR